MKNELNTKVIYKPKGRAGEYSQWATNLFRGCGHKCVYCYVPGVIRMSREDFDTGATPKKDILKRLKKDAVKIFNTIGSIQVMHSFTTDPYNPDDTKTGLTREAIQILQTVGHSVCTLTKGGKRALRDLDLFRPGVDAFATTLTSLYNDVSLEWEPEAALPYERMSTLEAFHSKSIETWVSLEPVYSPEQTLKIIEQTHEFVDLYKVGTLNRHRRAREIDWHKFGNDVIELLEGLGCQFMIKEDLKAHLGYKV